MRYIVPFSWSLYAAVNAKLSFHLWSIDDRLWSVAMVVPILVCMYRARSTFDQARKGVESI